jgi:predicted CoA-binding protein
MNPPDGVLHEVLDRTRTIAVAGLSDTPQRDSNGVARYLQRAGYRIVPVNPNLSEVLGERCYPNMTEIPPNLTVDLVDIFRRSDQVLPIVDAAIARRVPVVWMQLGVTNSVAAERSRAAGLTVVEDLCIMREHQRLEIGRGRARP